jgi:hypothetical protein
MFLNVGTYHVPQLKALGPSTFSRSRTNLCNLRIESTYLIIIFDCRGEKAKPEPNSCDTPRESVLN